MAAEDLNVLLVLVGLAFVGVIVVAYFVYNRKVAALAHEIQRVEFTPADTEGDLQV